LGVRAIVKVRKFW